MLAPFREYNSMLSYKEKQVRKEKTLLSCVKCNGSAYRYTIPLATVDSKAAKGLKTEDFRSSWSRTPGDPPDFSINNNLLNFNLYVISSHTSNLVIFVQKSYQ